MLGLQKEMLLLMSAVRWSIVSASISPETSAATLLILKSEKQLCLGLIEIHSEQFRKQQTFDFHIVCVQQTALDTRASRSF